MTSAAHPAVRISLGRPQHLCDPLHIPVLVRFQHGPVSPLSRFGRQRLGFRTPFYGVVEPNHRLVGLGCRHGTVTPTRSTYPS